MSIVVACAPAGTGRCSYAFRDVRTSEFAEEARRQAELVAASGQATDDQDFVDAVSVDWDEE